MNRKILLFITIVLIVIGLAVGAYFFLEDKLYKEYLLDSRLSNQFYEISFDIVEQTSDVVELGYIRLNNKEYKVSYKLNSESLNMMDIEGELTIEDEKFDVLNGASIYLLPDAILISDQGNCQHISFTIVDENLKEIVSDSGYMSYDDYLPELVNWNKKVVTYYKVIDKSMEMEEYQINFAGSKVENPKLIQKIKVTNYGCGAK